MKLSRLQDPFPADDVEWRISRCGTNNRGIFCLVLAYITARAIQNRLDDVVGPSNWKTEQPQQIEVGGKFGFGCGISIRIGDEWVTKWDVAEATHIEPIKGGFSGSMKRAGAQWGIGRYLYHLDETFADISDSKPGPNWTYAKTNETGVFYWLKPKLPAWALPKDNKVIEKEIGELKRQWKDKFAPDISDQAELRDGFSQFVSDVVGNSFPNSSPECWTREALEKCLHRVTTVSEPVGVSADVPFGE